MNDLQVKIGGSAEQLKQALTDAKSEINSFDKAAKNAGGNGLGKVGQDAGKLIGQFKEVGSKVQGLGGLLGGLVPALGPVGIAVAGITAAVNFGINKWGEYKAVVASLEQTFKDGEISGRKYLDAITGKNLKPSEDNARKRMIELEQERKRINAEQKGDKGGDYSKSLIGGALEDKAMMKRTDERQKRLNEIQAEQAANIEIIKKAEADKRKSESDAEVEASKVAAKAYQDEKKRTEEAKKRYNEASFAASTEEEQLGTLREQASELSKIADAQEDSSAEQIEAAAEYLKIQKQISDILEKRADKQKTQAEKEGEKQKELKQIVYDRIWSQANEEQRLAQAQKEYLEAKAKAEKDANTANLIALEKAKNKVIEQKKAVADLNKEKGKGDEPKDRPRTRDGKSIVNEEDRARSEAEKARNAGFTAESGGGKIRVNGVSLAKPRAPSVDSGKSSQGANANDGATWQQDIKDIKSYLVPKKV